MRRRGDMNVRRSAARWTGAGAVSRAASGAHARVGFVPGFRFAPPPANFSLALRAAGSVRAGKIATAGAPLPLRHAGAARKLVTLSSAPALLHSAPPLAMFSLLAD